MAQVTLTVNAARIYWSSPMLICANRNHVHNEYGWNRDDGSLNGGKGYRPLFVTELAKYRPAWGSDEYGRNTWGYRHGHEPTDGTNRLGDRGWDGFFFNDPGLMTREGPYPYDAMKFICQEMVDFQATATWVVNFGSAWLRHGSGGFSAPQHAADLVKWLNDPTNASRSAYWRAAPLNVKWFEMGNEMPMRTQYGHGSYLIGADGKVTNTLDESKPHFASNPSEYATYAAQLAHAMHAADAAREGGPVGIKCMFTTGTGQHFDGNGGWGLGNDSYEVVKRLLNNAWTDANGAKVAAGTVGATLQIDGFIVHSYPSYPVMGDSKSATLKQKMAMVTWTEGKLAAARQAAIDFGDGRTLPWVNTEHFTKWYHEKDQRYAGAMYGIDVLMMAIRNGFVFNNAFCFYHGRNNDDEVWFYDGHPQKPTAWGTYMQLFAKHWGDQTVTAAWKTGTCPVWRHTYNNLVDFDVQHLAVAAAKSGDGNKLYVMILNRTEDTDHDVIVRQAEIAGFNFNEAAACRMAKLSFTGSNGAEADAWNLFKTEERTLLPANGTHHVLRAERRSAAIYEFTSTDVGSPPPPDAPAAPTITSIDPTQGPIGTLVTINGTGFSATRADNTIRFGGANGTIVPEEDKVSASATKLVVRVPVGALTGGIHVTVGGQSVLGPDFTVKATPPRIDVVEPMTGKVGDLVRIYGEYFNPADLTVLLGLLYAPVASATANLIEVRVPEGAVDYPVIVMTNGYTAETAGLFDVQEPMSPTPEKPPEASPVVFGMHEGRAFIDNTPIDGEAPWVLDWTGTDWGDTEHPEPSVIPTTGGTFTVYPIDTVMKPRRGKVVIYAQTDDELHKAKLETELKGLMGGRRILSNGSRHLEVQFLNAKEVQNDSRKAARMVGVEGAFFAPDPRWKLNQPIKGIFRPVRQGPQFGIYDDQLIPAVLPEYEFNTPTFTIQNWGTAWTYGAGFIQNGPKNTVVYVKGAGDVRSRVVIDGNGNGTFDEGHELFLKPGRNAIRLERLDGTLIVAPDGFLISFATTSMRFL